MISMPVTSDDSSRLANTTILSFIFMFRIRHFTCLITCKLSLTCKSVIADHYVKIFEVFGINSSLNKIPNTHTKCSLNFSPNSLPRFPQLKHKMKRRN